MDANSTNPADQREHVAKVRREAELIYSESEVDDACQRIADEISRRTAEEVPVLVCVLLGGIIPTAKIMERMEGPVELSYVHATRYRGRTTGDELVWEAPVYGSVRDRTVVIIDDILDVGDTMLRLEQAVRQAGAKKVIKVVLTKKQRSVPPKTTADIVGLEVPDRYVFGSGMDYHGFLRNLPGIWALARS